MSGVGSALAVVMFVGAANSEATPEQRAELKDAITVLRDDSLNASEAYVAVVLRAAEIMGPDWRPTGEWDEWITALIGEQS